jgi:hypothetical protein
MVERGLPVPSLRTFAAPFQACAHSEETSLRHRGCARFPTPLEGTGNPLRVNGVSDAHA